MANTDKVFAIPDQITSGVFGYGATAQQSIVITAGNVAWGYGAWKEIKERTKVPINIYGIIFQVTAIPSVDTVQEYIVEIGVGSLDNETTIIQVPYSQKADTNVGIYLTDSQIMLPEPRIVPELSRISVRMASTTANVTINGLRIMYTATESIWTPEWYANNYQRMQAGSGMSTSMGGTM